MRERRSVSGGRVEDGLLKEEELTDAGFGEVEHAVEFGAGVGVFLCGGLGFDEAAGAEHDDVHIDGGAGVFFVAEVEQGVAVDDADGGGGDHFAQGEDLRLPASTSLPRAMARATEAPVMAAQRVPPSAWRTSQSRMTVRSPRASCRRRSGGTCR